MKKENVMLLLAAASLATTSCENVLADDKERAVLVPKPPRTIRQVTDMENTPLLNEKDFFRMAGEIYGYAGRCIDAGLISPKQADELRKMCASYNQCATKYIEVYGKFLNGIEYELDAEAMLGYTLIVEE